MAELKGFTSLGASLPESENKAGFQKALPL